MIRILHLEDNPRDARFARDLLRQQWPDIEIRLVDTRADFLAELECGHDLVLSDFSLTQFNGLEALHLAREKVPSLPFIFLSGTIGEERALDALRAGATDYLLKDRPQRLVAAIERAMREVQRERERAAAAEQMLRVQRLESIGMLAAGIAHDFNNALAPMLMGVSLFRSRLTSEGDQRILKTMENSALRGASLVKQILGLAQGIAGEKLVLQPKHPLREMLEFMRQTFPKSLEIVEELQPNLWPVRINPTHLHQILLNLCVNARDAMPGGGRLTLRAGNRGPDAVSAAAVTGVKPGNHLMLEVSDTGAGIAPEVAARIWEPFFTTKSTGTGLGLPTVRSLVETYQGAVTFSTRAGQGTTFQIWLPAESDDQRNSGGPFETAIPQAQGELVLLADADASVRDLAAATLVAHGYRVLAAGTGTDAVALLAPRSLEVKLVIAEFDLPHLNGPAFARVVAALNPRIRVLLVSGAVAEDAFGRNQDDGSAFLAKPYSAPALLAAMHRLLAAPASPAGTESPAAADR